MTGSPEGPDLGERPVPGSRPVTAPQGNRRRVREPETVPEAVQTAENPVTEAAHQIVRPVHDVALDDVAVPVIPSQPTRRVSRRIRPHDPCPGRSPPSCGHREPAFRRQSTPPRPSTAHREWKRRPRCPEIAARTGSPRWPRIQSRTSTVRPRSTNRASRPAPTRPAPSRARRWNSEADPPRGTDTRGRQRTDTPRPAETPFRIRGRRAAPAATAGTR